MYLDQRQINIALQGAYNAFIEINKRSPKNEDEWESIYTDARRMIKYQTKLFNELTK